VDKIRLILDANDCLRASFLSFGLSRFDFVFELIPFCFDPINLFTLSPLCLTTVDGFLFPMVPTL